MKKELIVHKNPKSPNSEIFRTLRTNIQFMNTKRKLQTLLVTSTFPAEGKSWIASNLAVTFAQAGKKVVLIDADMRKGRQYRIFEIAPKPGLSNYLSEAEVDENGKSSIDIASYLQETGVENLYCIPAGNVPPNPSELLVSTQMICLLEDLKKICDLVIIDGTPCELVTDSIILSRIVDCTVIVAAYKITKKDALERVIKNIKNVGGNLAGVVLNKVNINSKRYGQQYYYYGDHKNNNKKGKTLDLKINPFGNKAKAKTDNDNLEKNIAKLYQDRNLQDNQEPSDINQKTDKEKNQNDYTPQEQNVKPNVEPVPNETPKDQEIPNTVYNNIQNEPKQEPIEADFLAKTNEILAQINEYLNEEKNKLK